MTASDHPTPKATRPFSPSPPRENRHTASRPPSLFLGASAPVPLVASSSSFSLAGLPPTPPPLDADTDGLPQRHSVVGHFLTSGTPSRAKQLEEERFRDISDGIDVYSSHKNEKRSRRDSDSSTSPASPPLGAASLLQTLIENQPTTVHGSTTVLRRTPSVDASSGGLATNQDKDPGTPEMKIVPGSPDSHHSRDSTVSTSVPSLPRIHQPTVVRSSSGRGLAFLPPPAQVSPTSSSFTVHQGRGNRSSVPKHAEDFKSQEEREQTWRSRSRSIRERTQVQRGGDQFPLATSTLATLPLRFQPSGHAVMRTERPKGKSATNEAATPILLPPTIGDETGGVKAASLKLIKDKEPTACARVKLGDVSALESNKETETSSDVMIPLPTYPQSRSRPMLGRAVSHRRNSSQAAEVKLHGGQAKFSDDEIVLNEISDPEITALVPPPSTSHTSAGTAGPVYVYPYKARTVSSTISPRRLHISTGKNPIVITVIASIGTSRSVIPFSSRRLEVDLVWADKQTSQWIPGGGYIPSIQVRYLSGSPTGVIHKPSDLVLLCRQIANEVVAHIPILWRLKNWI